MAVYIGVFALGYIIIKKLFKRFTINKKFIFILFAIASNMLAYTFTVYITTSTTQLGSAMYSRMRASSCLEIM